MVVLGLVLSVCLSGHLWLFVLSFSAFSSSFPPSLSPSAPVGRLLFFLSRVFLGPLFLSFVSLLRRLWVSVSLLRLVRCGLAPDGLFFSYLVFV